MTYHLTLSAALAAVLATAASAEDVTLRYLSSHGGLNAHELAWELGYFEGTGITLENLGYSTGGPESLIALAAAAAVTERIRERLHLVGPTVSSEVDGEDRIDRAATGPVVLRIAAREDLVIADAVVATIDAA